MKDKMVLFKETKGKRFSITYHKGITNEEYATYDEEMRNILKDLIFLGYTEVKNANGGDDDFLCIDHLKQKYIWCENGFAPFYIPDLNKYEKLENVNLEYLYSIRC